MTEADSISFRRKAVCFLLLTAVLWSSSGLCIKMIQWGPLAILSGRSIVAAVVFLIYLRRPEFRWSSVQVAGALAYTSSHLLFILGTKLTVAANVVFLTFTSPIYIILFGYWFLNERPYRADWMAMAAIFTGMFLFFGDDLSLNGMKGNLCGALAGVALAMMIMCMRRQKMGVPANTILLGNFFGAIIGLPFLLQETFTLSSVSTILFLGIFQIGISFILYSIAIKHVHALESTLIVTLEPVLNPVWVFLVLGEIPGKLAFMGGILVLGAVIARAVVSSQTVPGDAV